MSGLKPQVRIKPTAVHQAVYSTYSRPIRSTTRISSSQNTTVHVPQKQWFEKDHSRSKFFAGFGTHVSPRGGGGRQISICCRDLSKISHIFKATLNNWTALQNCWESKTPDSLGTLLPAGFLPEGHPQMFFRRHTNVSFLLLLLLSNMLQVSWGFTGTMY